VEKERLLLSGSFPAETMTNKLAGGPGSGVSHENTEAINMDKHDLSISPLVTIGHRRKIMQSRMEPKSETLDPKKIRFIGQGRYVIQKLGRLMSDPDGDWVDKPIQVLRVDGKLHLLDGHHRFLAALRLHKPTIKARVWTMTKETVEQMVSPETDKTATLNPFKAYANFLSRGGKEMNKSASFSNEERRKMLSQFMTGHRQPQKETIVLPIQRGDKPVSVAYARPDLMGRAGHTMWGMTGGGLAGGAGLALASEKVKGLKGLKGTKGAAIFGGALLAGAAGGGALAHGQSKKWRVKDKAYSIGPDGEILTMKLNRADKKKLNNVAKKAYGNKSFHQITKKAASEKKDGLTPKQRENRLRAIIHQNLNPIAATRGQELHVSPMGDLNSEYARVAPATRYTKSNSAMVGAGVGMMGGYAAGALTSKVPTKYNKARAIGLGALGLGLGAASYHNSRQWKLGPHAYQTTPDGVLSMSTLSKNYRKGESKKLHKALTAIDKKAAAPISLSALPKPLLHGLGIGAAGGTMNVLKQKGEAYSDQDHNRRVNPYRVARAAILSGGLGAGASHAYGPVSRRVSKMNQSVDDLIENADKLTGKASKMTDRATEFIDTVDEAADLVRRNKALKMTASPTPKARKIQARAENIARIRDMREAADLNTQAAQNRLDSYLHSPMMVGK
jgi:hypothetical protein